MINLIRRFFEVMNLRTKEVESELPDLTGFQRLEKAWMIRRTNGLFIRLRPSRQLAILLSLAHGTAAGVFWPLALPVMIKVTVTLLLAGSLYYYLRRYVWLISPQAIISLRLTGKNTCSIWLLTNNRVDCLIHASTFVASYMTVLCLKTDQTAWRRTVVILPDGIDTEKFRQLRVWLRWKWRDERLSQDP